MTALRRDGQHQSDFSKWMRENPRLDSRDEFFVCTDIDWIVHRYASRSVSGVKVKVQNVMMIEEKTHGRRPTFPQSNIFAMIERIFFKGRQMPLRDPESGARVWGFHVLCFSGSGPYDSDWIEWDEHRITLDMLEKLLLFKVNPYTLKARDERSHHGTVRQTALPFAC